ncbi:MAG: EMC3/TMCO1 family protein [Candidatus Nanoarchaeia archaeon]|nr:EMC3/TMCO1 family protein [Candidatus Nanoarchaeia archaeon]MDD5358177.1 EMC3/TMCO1 family protein [Candidatus Nanoarchaeia archaeon]MDD5589443.1 EMC3/TMCO1 family protein [Candidatus Nanoarchaeia archaeon]
MANEENIEKKEGQPQQLDLEKDKQGKKKEGSFLPVIIIMGLSLLIAFWWDKFPVIKDSVHSVLNPSAGWLLDWNLEIGMILIVFIITLMTTLIQKYTTDQKALRELRAEQKILQEEMKKYENHPEKITELSKKQLSFIPKTYKLMSRSFLFTGVPFILFFRWFNDYFIAAGDPQFFGFLNWFWFYFIVMMIFSGILRKWLKVV